MNSAYFYNMNPESLGAGKYIQHTEEQLICHNTSLILIQYCLLK